MAHLAHGIDLRECSRACAAACFSKPPVTQHARALVTDRREWREGFSTKFGIVSVDFKNKTLPRAPKQSAQWLKKYVFTKTNAQ